MIRAALCSLALFTMALSAHAGGCYPVVKQAVVAQPVYSYAFYFVGQPIREQAVMQKAVQADPLWQEFQEFKAWRAQRSAVPSDALPLAAPATVLHATCVKCHSGEEPKGDLRLDGELSAEQKLKMMAKVWAGEMPPTAPLDNERAAELFEELLGAIPEKRETAGELPPPPSQEGR